MILKLRQFWPAIVGAYVFLISGLIEFNVLDNLTDEQTARIMGVPAVVGAFVVVRSHASAKVLDELDQ